MSSSTALPGNTRLKVPGVITISVLPASKKPSEKKASPKRTRTRKPTSRKTASTAKHATPRRAKAHRIALDKTFVYECTSPGCGYRIWRDEEGEPGHVRFDLKCPKCHRESFKCLGRGDVPESFAEQSPTMPTTALDFDKVDKIGLGTI